MSDNQPLRIAVILGSTRRGRFGDRVANWFMEEVQRHEGVAADLVDLAETELPEELRDFGEDLPPAAKVLAPRLAGADAFVVVTPEYNHSFPAPLKTAIDWFGLEWQAKPVGFVSYGGMAGGLRAVEHLRQVFAEVHAVGLRDTVSFHGAWEQFDSDGAPVNAEACGAAAKTLLDQLVWWGLSLREAREKRPYNS